MAEHNPANVCLNVVFSKQELSSFPCRQISTGWDRPPDCSQLQQLSLPRNSRIIEQESFPPVYFAFRHPHFTLRRAFAGCTQLRAFRKMGKSKTWRGTYARTNGFDKCEQLDKPSWLRFLAAKCQRSVETRLSRSNIPGLGSPVTNWW